MAAIHAEHQLILLGDPGSGKSTLLRFLVYCLAMDRLQPQAGWRQKLNWQRERLSELRGTAHDDDEDVTIEEQHWTDGAPLPILIELRDFASTDFDAHSPLALWRYV